MRGQIDKMAPQNTPALIPGTCQKHLHGKGVKAANQLTLQ